MLSLDPEAEIYLSYAARCNTLWRRETNATERSLYGKQEAAYLAIAACYQEGHERMLLGKQGGEFLLNSLEHMLEAFAERTRNINKFWNDT